MKNIIFIVLTFNIPLIAMDHAKSIAEYEQRLRRRPFLTDSERLSAYKKSMREKYYPLVLAAQTQEGNELAFNYFYGQLMKRPLPNGIPFEQAYIYWGEKNLSNPNDPTIRILKTYAQDVLTLAFVLRKHGLKKEETGWELFKAVDAVNWDESIKNGKQWAEIKTAIDQFNSMRRQRDTSRINE